MQTVKDIARIGVRPIHPGVYLRRVLQHLSVSQEALAEAMGTSRFTINQIVTDKRAVTPAMALRLSKATGTSVDVWLNLQRQVDLFDAYQEIENDLKDITLARDIPVRTILLEEDASPLELYIHQAYASAFPSFDDIPLPKNPSRSNSTQTVGVFALSSPEAISKLYGKDAFETVVATLIKEMRAVETKSGLSIYHLGFEALAIVLDDEVDNPSGDLEQIFSEITTSVDYDQLRIKVTLTGGLARTAAETDLSAAAESAYTAMESLRRRRSGEERHLWS